MIEWGTPSQTGCESTKPRGYTITVVPFGERCHVVATYSGPEGPPSLFEKRDIPGGAYSRSTVDLRRKATSEAKAACEAHAASLG